MKACGLSSKIHEAGFLGKKNQKGFYLYDEKGKEGGINQEILSLLPAKHIEMDETTIQMRVFLPMINEAAYILAENITDSAEVVDIGLIFGLGFPPFRGGLLKYADNEGLDRIAAAIERFSESVDPARYNISGYLKDLATSHKSFYRPS
jgi:3-hydroxyacyl-CoA dehydrogenase/enoyl-CoA hydratase/3-hydroxybutyryl-CoA epimerase